MNTFGWDYPAGAEFDSRAPWNKTQCHGTNVDGSPCENAATYPHPCPFASEVDEDDTTCDCCEKCEEQCARHI